MSWWRQLSPQSAADNVRSLVQQIESGLPTTRGLDVALFDQVTIALGVVVSRRLRQLGPKDAEFVRKLIASLEGEDAPQVQVPRT